MNNFDDIIQQKANAHEAPVPPGAWEHIEQKKKKRRFGFFWWMICILLCGLSIVGYYNYHNSSTSNTIVADKNERSPAGHGLSKQIETITTPTQQTVNTKDNSEKVKTIDNAQVSTNNPASKSIKNNDDINDSEIKTSNENKIVNKKTGSSVLKNEKKNNVEASALAKKDIEKKDASWAHKNNIIKKEKGNANIITQAGETEITETNKEEKKIKDDVAVSETIKNMDQRELISDKKELPAQPSLSKKDLVVDSVQKKLVATPPLENKKQKTAINKPAKKHSWFIDLGVSPILPIQQYDPNTTFSRTLVSSNNLSVFTGKLVNTSIDASVAFSIAARKEISKKISVGLGLQYLQLKEHISISGTETNTKYSIVDRLVDNVSGPQLVSDTVKTITEGSRQISATNSYTFLSIPVFIQYNFIQKRSWSLGAVAGAYINVYGKYRNEINKNTAAQLIASSQTKNEGNPVGVALYGGFRFGKRISKKLELFGTPSVTWALGRQNIENSLLNKKIQKLGLNIGLSYRLN